MTIASVADLWGWAVLCLLLIPAALGVRLEWRGQGVWSEHPPNWWIWDDISWRGFRRALPAGTITTAVAVVGLVPTAIERVGGPSAPSWWRFVLLGGLVVSAGLMLLTAFFGRPKCLVAPGLRNEPGALSEWRRARRSSRGRG